MSKHIEEHTLKVLEFDAVRDTLASFASSGLGRQAARDVYPSLDANWLTERLAETTQMKNLLERGIRIPLSGLRDIRDTLKNIGTRATVFEPADLLEIADTLAASGRLKIFFEQEMANEPVPQLHALAQRLLDFGQIVDHINASIAGDQTVRDEASPKLTDIRRQIAHIGSQIQQRFQTIINDPQVRSAVEIDRFLTRNGRAVVALKATHRHQLKGVILDRSNTGATLYIEPYALTELSNALEDAVSAEKNEITRILWQLTHEILERQHDILIALRVLTQIDLTYAKARYSLAYDMNAPQVSKDAFLRLVQARHPLLLRWAVQQHDNNLPQALDAVVPIDVRIGDHFDMLIVTGPNTGGKTVTLKTIGLVTLMAQSGMHVPARSDSQIPIYRQVYADIGDEQSIQQSLSTFSAHISRIIHILARANQYSLVLLDELGAGTDPHEGATLAGALLDEFHHAHARVVATTHLGRLKTYAYATPRVENACVRFDVKTLRPTYELLTGTPGASNALAIAQRLGMPRKIVHRAQKQLARHADSSAALINQVQASRQAADNKRRKAHAILHAIKGMHVVAAERLARATEEAHYIKQQAENEIDKSMRHVNKLVDDFVAEMKNAPKPFSDRAADFARDFASLAADAPLAQRQLAFAQNLTKGDTVYVESFKRTATVQRLRRNRQTLILTMDAKEVEVPFSDVWPPNTH